MNPPRYLCWLDRDAFLRELSHYAYDTIGKQLGRDISRLAEDLILHYDTRGRELHDLRRAYEELEDEHFKVTT